MQKVQAPGRPRDLDIDEQTVHGPLRKAVHTRLIQGSSHHLPTRYPIGTQDLPRRLQIRHVLRQSQTKMMIGIRKSSFRGPTSYDFGPTLTGDAGQTPTNLRESSAAPVASATDAGNALR